MLIPFELKVEELDRMLNFEIANHDIYSGLEIQGFDDAMHGSGMVIFLGRKENDLTDVYFESSLKQLDPKLYGIGGGLGLWKEWTFEVAKLSIQDTNNDDDDQGIVVEIKFNDIDGRLIEVQIQDPTPLSHRSFSEFLAPVGSAIVHPKSLLLVWMSRFDLLYRRGPTPIIRIDHQPVATGQLPMEWLLRRRLIKVASDLFIVAVNPVLQVDDDDNRQEQPLPQHDLSNLTITSQGLESIKVTRGKHIGKLDFSPAFPDMETMESDATQTGFWSMTLDNTSVAAGSWSLVRANNNESSATVVLEVDQGWKPQRLSVMMRFITWAAAKVFREWPTTYKYTSTISFRDHESPTMKASWERIGSEQRAEAYRAMMGTN